MRLELVSDYNNYLYNLFQFHKGAIRTNHRKPETRIHLYFNSIKVRLEQELENKYARDSYFNSIKVRLEPYKPVDYTDLWSFQFHKGAIRTPSGCNTMKNTSLFQFHKGAIRTTYKPVDYTDLWRFQFHKGAIRTVCGFQINLVFIVNFNSIKVRLEQN